MTSNKIQLALIVFMVVFVATSGEAFAEKACFQCHKKSLFEKKVVHKPLAKGNCVSCHNPHVAAHDGLLQDKLGDLCLSCHEKSFEAKGKRQVIHEPVRQGKCTTCHDPHSSNYQNLLKGKLTEICLGCHESLKRNYKNTHKPYEKGQCDACHSMHLADNFQLLNSSPEKICQSCHNASEVKNTHKNYPLEIKGCLTCHNPHGSQQKAMIRDVIHQPFADGCKDCHDKGGGLVRQEKCLSCHEEIKTELFASHNHLTKANGNACTNCHSPHAGDSEKLLKGRQLLVCRNCHDDTFKRHEDDIFVHKTAFNECSKCHAVHGTNQVALLKGDGNQVCVVCHETQGQFSHPVGESVIDPRNRQMTTCVSCHNPHGSNFKGQLVLSGQEELCVQCHHM